jgi:hypothetical protein
MKTFFNQFKIISIVAITLLFTSCEKNNEDSIYLSKKVKLIEAKFEDNVVSLEWTKPYIRNLRGYTVLRYDSMPGPLEYIEKCVNNNGEEYCYKTPNYYADVVASITDPEQTTYIDDNIAITNEVYYRIIAIGDSSIESNVLRVDIADVEIIEYYSTEIVYQSSSNCIFFFENNSTYNTLIKYSVDNGEIVDSVHFENDNYNYYSNELKLLNAGASDLVVIWNYNEFKVYNANTLDLVGTFDFGYYSVNSVTSNNNNYIFVSAGDYIYTLSASNISQVSSYYNYKAYYLFYYNDTLLTIDNYSYAPYSYYSVSSDGKLTESNNGYTSSYQMLDIMNSANGNLISNRGEVMSYNLTSLGGISFDYYSSYTYKFSFDPINNRLINTIYQDKEVEVYSLSSFGSPLKTYQTLGWPISSFVDTDGNYIVVSSTASYGAKSIIIEQL